MADRTQPTDETQGPYQGDLPQPRDLKPTPDNVESRDNVGRRAQAVNGAVLGAGAGAGGGGGPEDFDSDPQGGGDPIPKPVENDAREKGGDARVHGSH